MNGLYFDELVTGTSYELGSYAFTRDNILAFARKYDPQPFHVDDAAAAAGPFGKLAASGWHTAAAWMKCFVTSSQREADKRRAAGHDVAAPGPSPGIRDLKWTKPVYPGDTIRYRSTIIAARHLVSRADYGLIFARNEGFNDAGDLVISFESAVMARRRPAA
jgi:acyl dehydratase